MRKCSKSAKGAFIQVGNKRSVLARQIKMLMIKYFKSSHRFSLWLILGIFFIGLLSWDGCCENLHNNVNMEILIIIIIIIIIFSGQQNETLNIIMKLADLVCNISSETLFYKRHKKCNGT